MSRLAFALVGLFCSTNCSAAGPAPPSAPAIDRGLIQRIAENLEKSPIDRLLPYVGPQGHEPGRVPVVPEYDEAVERSRIAHTADRLLWSDDASLRELETMLETYRLNGERTGAGLFKFIVASLRFDGSNYPDWRQNSVIDYRLKALDDWVRLVPESKFPSAIKAMMLVNKAYLAMSDAHPSDEQVKTPPDPQSFLKEAQAILNADKAGREANPVWHQMMIKVRAAQDASVEEILVLLDEGSNRFPLVLDIYLEAVDAVLRASTEPQRDVAAIAHLAGIRAASEGTAAYYTRVYWAVARKLGPEMVREFMMDPSKFEAGARQIVQRYPVQWTYQHLAWMACAIGDGSVAKAMFPQVKGRPIARVWGQIEYFDKCAAWTKSLKPDPVQKATGNQRPN